MNFIKYVVFDVDGTLTDGKLYIGAAGEVFKAFDVKDGCAIHDILPQYGIIPIVMTARKSDIVERRCEELNIKECYQSVRNKRKKLEELALSWGIKPDSEGVFKEVAYVGDDIIDLSCMQICGFTACPNDAVKEVKEYADYISARNGGNGAVRDVIEKIVGMHS